MSGRDEAVRRDAFPQLLGLVEFDDSIRQMLRVVSDEHVFVVLQTATLDRDGGGHARHALAEAGDHLTFEAGSPTEGRDGEAAFLQQAG